MIIFFIFVVQYNNRCSSDTAWQKDLKKTTPWKNALNLHKFRSIASPIQLYIIQCTMYIEPIFCIHIYIYLDKWVRMDANAFQYILNMFLICLRTSKGEYYIQYCTPPPFPLVQNIQYTIRSLIQMYIRVEWFLKQICQVVPNCYPKADILELLLGSQILRKFECNPKIKKKLLYLTF